MEVRILNAQVSELCLGKPELKGVSATTTISDALTALKRSAGQTHVSVWSCGNNGVISVGKISVADVILFLCRPENLENPFEVLKSPVSDLLDKGTAPVVRHLEPESSLVEAMDYILEGAQNLVIPIQNNWISSSRRMPNKSMNHVNAYCWLTQEDVVRFNLSCIGAFSPVPTLTIDSLNIIDREIYSIHYNSPASSALTYFKRALNEQTSIAVVDENKRLIGEISPFTLARCDETVAAAIMALSAGDLMDYVDCRGPPDDLVHLVKTRLEEQHLSGMLDFMGEIFGGPSSSSSSSCSSDDESWSNRNVGAGERYPGRRPEAIVCGPNSSLVAMMFQALTHRVSCVWVVDEDCRVVGNVTFAGMLEALRNGGSGG